MKKKTHQTNIVIPSAAEESRPPAAADLNAKARSFGSLRSLRMTVFILTILAALKYFWFLPQFPFDADQEYLAVKSDVVFGDVGVVLPKEENNQ